MRIDGEMVSLGRDPQKALAYFNAAVAMGHVEAMFQAALLYADGQETLTIARCTVSACVCVVCVCVVCVVCVCVHSSSLSLVLYLIPSSAVCS